MGPGIRGIPARVPRPKSVADSEPENGLVFWGPIINQIEAGKARPFSGSESETDFGFGIRAGMSQIPRPTPLPELLPAGSPGGDLGSHLRRCHFQSGSELSPAEATFPCLFSCLRIGRCLRLSSRILRGARFPVAEPAPAAACQLTSRVRLSALCTRAVIHCSQTRCMQKNNSLSRQVSPQIWFTL